MTTDKFKEFLKLIALALSLAVACPAFSQVMMSSDTESKLSQNVKPPKGVIDLIIANEPDSANQLKECMANNGRGQILAADLFSVRVIRLNNDDLPDYFVRPAIEPYCGAFYGAHLFRYWFVLSYREKGKIRYRIVFKSGGDEVRVLTHVTNGYHDLELVGHNAIEVATSTWRFDGKKYAASGCFLRKIDAEDGRTTQC
jgi:hypothetical protein